ncbi:MAG: hypothetical protein IJZ78_07765 [Alistipes sp.]|nr:hypothetical protein [Alistipes sp.]
MKKIFALAVLFAAISLVACGGEQKKAADAEAEAAVECCGDCQQAEAAEECCGECQKAEGECCGEKCAEGECQKAEGECCGDCKKDGECQKAEGECCSDCQKAEVADEK